MNRAEVMDVEELQAGPLPGETTSETMTRLRKIEEENQKEAEKQQGHEPGADHDPLRGPEAETPNTQTPEPEAEAELANGGGMGMELGG